MYKHTHTQTCAHLFIVVVMVVVVAFNTTFSISLLTLKNDISNSFPKVCLYLQVKIYVKRDFPGWARG